jgi:hypothetical protein
MFSGVIASEAKQSISPRKGRMDCFVARAPRNDVVRSRFTFQTADTRPPSRGAGGPEVCMNVCPLDRRGSRECRVRAAPAVSCARCTKENAHEHTGSAETLRHSPRNGFTAYIALSPATNSSCHRRCRLDGWSIRLDRNCHRQLGTSNGCRDHTVLPYAESAVRPARRSIAHEKLALRHRFAPTLKRPPHPLPRS